MQSHHWDVAGGFALVGGIGREDLDQAWPRVGLLLARECAGAGGEPVDKADRALELCDESSAVSEAHSELWALSWAHWVRGLAYWTLARFEQAAVALRDSLRPKHALDDRLGMSACAELLAWTACEAGASHRAAQLLGAAKALLASTGHPLFGWAEQRDIHDGYRERLRLALGGKVFGHCHALGEQMSVSEVLSFACDDAVPEPAGGPRLTRREKQVAELIAEGLTNKQIATRLVISQRTAEGHVEHVLAKLSFTSRAQVAAWVATRA